MSDSTAGFNQLDDNELIELMRQAEKEGPNAANEFWSRFQYLTELIDGNYSIAQRLILDLLNKCSSLDNHTYKSIHKGTPYYWIATISFHCMIGVCLTAWVLQ